ncbi:lantibiotic dehydratase [Streptomyces sp. NPDC021224]|uniref:lantibiotic dehydratase n=1 Tax=unclassified Streptomyces TaxID=2593676 RepID=UPI0037A1684E
MTRSALRYSWQGPAIVRATTRSGVADVPTTLDLEDPAVVRPWLRRNWEQPIFRNALSAAAPGLADAVEGILDGREERPRQVRRVALSVASYLLRWQNRATPFGLFAGTAAVTVGTTAGAHWREKHRVLLRADAEWVTDLVLRLQENPELLRRLPVVANNTARPRGDRLVVMGPPSDARAQLMAPIEVSVRNARPVAAAVEAAREPINYADLHTHLQALIPQVAADRIDALLTGLIGQQILLTSLWAPTTTVDAFGHLCAELERVSADAIPSLRDLVTTLYDIRDEIAVQPPSVAPDAAQRVTAKMRALSDATPTPLAADTALDCEVRIPSAVMEEAQAAVTALYRTTPQPYGHPHWRDYHRRFRARYGVGARVPVLELVADSGLGLPAGYLGAERIRPPGFRTARDELLLALLQPVLTGAARELVLTDQLVADLSDAAGTEPHFLPRVETAFEIHAPTADAVTRGAFGLVLTAAPRAASSMAGRFAHILPPDQQEALAAGYRTDSDTLTVQLSFPPRKRRNENVVRTLPLLPKVLAVGETPAGDDRAVRLDDVAITADARHFFVVQQSTGRRLDIRVLHALEAGTQTPALARFLGEVAGARHAVYRDFDFGVAAHLPYLPRIRYRRTVLAPARWLVAADELPGHDAPRTAWDAAFEAWRTRLRVPDDVSLVEHDQRLPVSLGHPVHRRLLRSELDKHRRLELREAPGADAYGWIGRAHEIWVSFRRAGTTPPSDGLTAPVAAPEPAPLHLPGAGNVLYARLHAHPARYDEILTRHLPALLTACEDRLSSWWFTRHRETARPDADQYLDLVLHLTPGSYARAAEALHDWAGALHRYGLAAGLTLTGYRPQTGRFGHGEAMEAAHRVFAADSAAALAQIRLAEQPGSPGGQALAAAAVLDLAQHLAPSRVEGREWVVQQLPRATGRLDRRLRDEALDLASPAGRGALAGQAGGDAVFRAWSDRAAALAAYRACLGDADPLRAARSLAHQHHVRALGADPAAEAVTLRLARAAALSRRGATR